MGPSTVPKRLKQWNRPKQPKQQKDSQGIRNGPNARIRAAKVVGRSSFIPRASRSSPNGLVVGLKDISHEELFDSNPITPPEIEPAMELEADVDLEETTMSDAAGTTDALDDGLRVLALRVPPTQKVKAGGQIEISESGSQATVVPREQTTGHVPSLLHTTGRASSASDSSLQES